MTEEKMKRLIREAKNNYARNWRKKNPEKVRKINDAYWQRVAKRMEMEGKMKNSEAPFQKIADACRTTGLSMYYLRNGCKDGTVPCVKSGTKYLVNVPALLRKLGADSEERGARYDIR